MRPARYDVAYFEAGAEKEIVVRDVDGSALRLVAGEGGSWPPPPGKEASPPPPPPPPDENTGLGGWQTVRFALLCLGITSQYSMLAELFCSIHLFIV